MRIRVAVMALVMGAPLGCNSDAGPVTVGVLPPQEASLSVVMEPPAGELGVCGTIQLSVAVQDFSGAAAAPDSTRWTSSDTTVLWISATGMVHARKPALADTIRATVWHGTETGTGQQIWYVSDGRNLIAPCPTGGTAACAVPCPPGF